MLVNLPYTFIDMDGTTGERLPTIMASSYEIDIPEIATEDAPIAATWKMQEWHDGRDQAGRTVTCRYGQGGFFIQASPQGDVAVHPRVITDWQTNDDRSPWEFISYLVEGASGPEGRWVNFVAERAVAMDRLFGRKITSRPAISALSGRSFALWSGDAVCTEEADLRAAMERSSKLALIDGGVWRRVETPKIEERVLGGYPRFAMDFGDGLRREFETGIASPVDVDFHPLSDLAELVKRETSLRERTFFGMCDLRIENEDAFAFDRPLNIAHRTLLSVLEKHGPLVGDMAADAAERFVQLRDAVRAIGSQADADAIWRAFETALTAFAAAVGTGEDRHGIERRMRGATDGGGSVRVEGMPPPR